MILELTRGARRRGGGARRRSTLRRAVRPAIDYGQGGARRDAQRGPARRPRREDAARGRPRWPPPRAAEHRPNLDVVVARDPAEAARFSADHKRLGVIAARTNAFKLNEDVVLPLAALAEFSRWMDAVNLEEERENQAELAGAARLLRGRRPPRRAGARRQARPRARAVRGGAREDSWEGGEELRAAPPSRLLAGLRELPRLPGPRRGDRGSAHVARASWCSPRTCTRRRQRAREHPSCPTTGDAGAPRPRSTGSWSRPSRSAASARASTGSGDQAQDLDPALREAFAAYRREADPGGLMNPASSRTSGRWS